MDGSRDRADGLVTLVWLWSVVQGSTRDVLHKFTVDLPKKHGRGGQSAVRFARLRMEKRHNYVRKVRIMPAPKAYSQVEGWCRGLVARGWKPSPEKQCPATRGTRLLGWAGGVLEMRGWICRWMGYAAVITYAIMLTKLAVSQVAELAVQYFITNDRPNVAGLVLAGSADFKTELQLSDMFDPRLQVGQDGPTPVGSTCMSGSGGK